MEPTGTITSQWGEGPVWHNDRLYYVDIESHLVIAFDPVTGNEHSWNVRERVGCVVPRTSGGFVIAGDSGFRFLNPDSGELTPIADPEPNLPDNRFNDGKCDPAGRFWAGSISLVKKPGTANLYRLDANLSLHHILPDVTNSNGIVWNKNADTMFYIDTPTQRIDAFDFDHSTSAITNRRTVIDTTSLNGNPDGMAIDENDHLWIAMCHGGAVHQFDPNSPSASTPLSTLVVPSVEVTAPAFGGPDLTDLYITTGRSKIADGELDGRLFVAQPGPKGAPITPFAG
ncbi:MAG: SMP-30/gluconolactonase/LRE family protein [Verrucomicrobiota bacterium]